MSSFPLLNQDDHDLVRSYVTGADHLQYAQLPEGVVAILMTHSNLPSKHLDIRLDLHWTIEEVKEKFRKHIGTAVDHQRLILKSGGETICELNDNRKMLGYYSVSSGMEIFIIDSDPFSLSRGGGLTDTSLIAKYRMADEIYDQRKGTLRDYIREERKKDPNFKLKPNALAAELNKKNATTPQESGPPPGADSVEGITVGARCEVQPGGRRGVVMFVGEAFIKAGGYWVTIIRVTFLIMMKINYLFCFFKKEEHSYEYLYM